MKYGVYGTIQRFNCTIMKINCISVGTIRCRVYRVMVPFVLFHGTISINRAIRKLITSTRGREEGHRVGCG